MTVNANELVAITAANQDFSKIVRVVNEEGLTIIYIQLSIVYNTLQGENSLWNKQS